MYALQENPMAPNGWRTPGLSPSSKPPEDLPTCEPEPEVAPTQSMEEPFDFPATPCSIIIIDNTPIGLPPPQLFHLPLLPLFLPQISLPLPRRTQLPPPPQCQAPSFLR
ncbi:hypothetical protein O181_064653 [Austropuccinia psidii MF-1]|uniref:Uncharacterized protein n=1 Tax=Austropuccinia psidii MF-1 TaxID=1389203 RepID=A0A9Q3ETX6_9BASI|nr:hypothetical protein [Austropuccinia psidii MF-1]